MSSKNERLREAFVCPVCDVKHDFFQSWKDSYVVDDITCTLPRTTWRDQ